MELSKEQIRETIARRVAQELEDGDVVTLGIGLPTEVANYVPEDVQVMFHSENGLIGVGKSLRRGKLIRISLMPAGFPWILLRALRL